MSLTSGRPPCTPIFQFALLNFALALCCLSSFAQSQTPSGAQGMPHSCKPPTPVDQEQFISYWTTETGWRSELQLRNNLASQDLTVTPALRSADGAETLLSPITIKPQEVKTLDVEAAVIGSAPQFIGTYGSLVLRYHSPNLRNLFAMLMIRNVGHSIAYHFDALGEIQDPKGGTVWQMRDLLWSKRIPYIKLGRKFLIRPSDLRAFVEQRGKKGEEAA